MGWLASATLPPTFCLGFSQTFPVFISISVLASPECFLPSISMCYVVNEDREQSTPEETINKAPRTFVVAGESLQVFVHSSQRGISKDSPFLWKFQNCRIVKKNGASLFLTFSAPEQTRHCLWACPKVFVFMDKISAWRNGNKSMDSYLLKHSSVIWTNLSTVLKCGAFESIYSKNKFQMSQKILLMKVLKYLQRKKV